MSDYPDKIQMLPNEQVLHNSGGAVKPAILFLEEPGALSRPITGKVFLTNMRLLFEGKLPASGAKAVAVGAVGAVLLGPLGAVAGTAIKGDEVELIVPLSAITQVSKHERFGKDLIEVYHNQQGSNSPCFVGPGKDIDGVLMQIQSMIGSQRSVAPPPPPPPVAYAPPQRTVAPPPPSPPVAPPMPSQALSGKKSFCSSCGSPLEKGLKFCTNCGTKVEEGPRACPSCGSEAASDMKFCGNCGAKLI